LNRLLAHANHLSEITRHRRAAVLLVTPLVTPLVRPLVTPLVNRRLDRGLYRQFHRGFRSGSIRNASDEAARHSRGVVPRRP
jgi:hypothetical protein